MVILGCIRKTGIAMLFGIAILLASCLGYSVCEAAMTSANTREFVDSENHLGYYVDTATIQVFNDYEFSANVCVIKPSDDSMYVYDTYFNLATGTYQYLSSKLYQYTTKKLLSQSGMPTTVRSYADSKPMQAARKHIQAWILKTYGY